VCDFYPGIYVTFDGIKYLFCILQLQQAVYVKNNPINFYDPFGLERSSPSYADYNLCLLRYDVCMLSAERMRKTAKKVAKEGADFAGSEVALVGFALFLLTGMENPLPAIPIGYTIKAAAGWVIEGAGNLAADQGYDAWTEKCKKAKAICIEIIVFVSTDMSLFLRTALLITGIFT